MRCRYVCVYDCTYKLHMQCNRIVLYAGWKRRSHKVNQNKHDHNHIDDTIKINRFCELDVSHYALFVLWYGACDARNVN